MGADSEKFPKRSYENLNAITVSGEITEYNSDYFLLSKNGSSILL